MDEAEEATLTKDLLAALSTTNTAFPTHCWENGLAGQGIALLGITDAGVPAQPCASFSSPCMYSVNCNRHSHLYWLNRRIVTVHNATFVFSAHSVAHPAARSPDATPKLMPEVSRFRFLCRHVASLGHNTRRDFKRRRHHAIRVLYLASGSLD